MRIFYPDLSKTYIKLKGEDFNYLKNVLRARAGDEIILFNGKGQAASGLISSISKNEISVELKETFESNTESPLHITLLQGILKAQKMDFVVRKATELGVYRIQPVITERTEVRETRKVERWRKIASEASKQCGRAVVPEVANPVLLEEFLAGYDGAGIVFWEEGGKSLKDFRLKGNDIALIIGPEGGLTADEVSFALRKKFFQATLGPRILMAETAAISALSLVQFTLGDMG
jgi:16S rRNA (uracil1498-N3)-methyltransferase